MVDSAQPGVYTIRYTVSDTAGNTATQTRKVTVQDTQKPILSLVGGAEITLEYGETFSEPGAMATDSCDGNLSPQIEISGDVVGSDQPGTYTIQYTVSDTTGNVAVKTRYVQVGTPISSVEELEKIGNDADYPLDGGYFLTGNIDASSTETWNEGLGFEPIGREGNPFTGYFNGQGHAIL